MPSHRRWRRMQQQQAHAVAVAVMELPERSTARPTRTGHARALHALQRLEDAVDKFANQLQCPICLCTYATPMSLPCHHCFCEECIFRALEIKALCPICKAPTKRRKLRHDTMIQQLLVASDLLSVGITPPMPSPVSIAKTRPPAQPQHQQAPGSQAPTAAMPHPQPQVRAPSQPPPVLLAPTWQSQSQTPTPTQMPAASQPEATPTRSLPHKPEVVVASSLAASAPRPSSCRSLLLHTPTRPATTHSNGVHHTKPVDQQSSDASPHTVTSSHQSASTGSAETLTPSPTQMPLDLTTSGVVTPVRPRASEWISSAATTAISATLPPAPEMPTAAENDAVVAATEQQEYLPNGPFTVGQLVQVASRTWPGINKLGGTAWIMDVCNDGTYNVKYVIDSRREHSVHDYWIQKASEDIISDATPSRAVKRRQRRPSRSPGADSDEFASLISFSNGSGVSTGSIRSKKQKVRYQGKAFTDSGASMVLLCSGFNNETMAEIERWVDVLDARIVFEWSCEVTHLIVKCTITQAQSESDDDVEYVNEEAFRPSSPNGRRLSGGKRRLFADQDSATPKRWVNIRSLKYLKALVAGRWIVSEEWLQACFSHGGYVSETLYEADGHMKGQSIDSAVRRSRKTRESNIAAAPSSVNPSTIGTKLFEGLVFHVTGEFLSPMPPAREIEVLLQLGDGTLISSLSDAAAEMAKPENSGRRLVIVCDKINPASHKQMVRHIERLPELHAVANKAVVSYQWVLNSISEARVRPL